MTVDDVPVPTNSGLASAKTGFTLTVMVSLTLSNSQDQTPESASVRSVTVIRQRCGRLSFNVNRLQSASFEFTPVASNVQVSLPI